MIWKVEAHYWRSIGGWSDVYLVEAESKSEAEDKVKDYLDDTDPTISAEEVPLNEPYLIVEG